MGEWDEAPEWRRTEAVYYTAEQRGNIRSWGIAVLEPPAGLESGRRKQAEALGQNLDRIARGELKVVVDSGTCCGHGYHRATEWCGYIDSEGRCECGRRVQGTPASNADSTLYGASFVTHSGGPA